MKKLVPASKHIMGKYESRTRDSMIALMDSELNELTPEQREIATFSIDSYSHAYDPNDYHALFINYQRLETNKEETSREEFEARFKNEREARDRAEYLRLQKQFGNK